MNDQTTRATLSAADSRREFIAKNLSDVPAAYVDYHVGLDASQFEAQGKAARAQANAEVERLRGEQAARAQAADAANPYSWVKMPPPAADASDGRWSFVKMPA